MTSHHNPERKMALPKQLANQGALLPEMAVSIKCIHVCEEEKGEISMLPGRHYLNICDKINEWSTLHGIQK